MQIHILSLKYKEDEINHLAHQKSNFYRAKKYILLYDFWEDNSVTNRINKVQWE